VPDCIQKDGLRMTKPFPNTDTWKYVVVHAKGIYRPKGRKWRIRAAELLGFTPSELRTKIDRTDLPESEIDRIERVFHDEYVKRAREWMQDALWAQKRLGDLREENHRRANAREDRMFEDLERLSGFEQKEVA
jgi:hypothetical protein